RAWWAGTCGITGSARRLGRHGGIFHLLRDDELASVRIAARATWRFGDVRRARLEPASRKRVSQLSRQRTAFSRRTCAGDSSARYSAVCRVAVTPSSGAVPVGAARTGGRPGFSNGTKAYRVDHGGFTLVACIPHVFSDAISGHCGNVQDVPAEFLRSSV